MLPNFYIVGAARSGTTSLTHYLGQHPQIYMSPHKEASFFVAEHLPPTFQGPGDERANRLFIRDRGAYEALFDGAHGKPAVGECSVLYLYYPAASAIAQAAPDAKIVILLRHPVDRAYSAYLHQLRDGREQMSFEEGLAREDERKRAIYEPMWYYFEMGCYAQPVRAYLDYFGGDRVHVVWYDEFVQQPRSVMMALFEFLGVEAAYPVNVSVRYNQSGRPKLPGVRRALTRQYALTWWLKRLVPARWRHAVRERALGMTLERPVMSSDTRSRLLAAYAADIDRLEVLLDKDLSDWRR